MSDVIAESGYEKSYHDGFWLVYDQRVNNREQAHLSGLRAVAEAVWEQAYKAGWDDCVTGEVYCDDNPYGDGRTT